MNAMPATKPVPNRLAITALALVLVATATATHPRPDFTLQANTSAKIADFATNDGTLQGVATDGSYYYTSTTSGLAKYDATGSRAWLRDTSNDGQGGAAQTDLTIHAGKIYVGHKAGTSTNPVGAIGIYSATTGTYQGEVVLPGAGTPSTITYNHGAYWVIWAPSNSETYQVRRLNDDLSQVASYNLPRTYPADTGPQGAAWIDYALLLPRHASNGQNLGIDVFRFSPHHAQPGFNYESTMPYATWTTNSRTEVSSQGIDTRQDHNGWTIIAAGRDASTGNGNGKGGILHARLDLERTQTYDSALLRIEAPSQKFTLTNGTLQGVATGPAGTFVTTNNALLRLNAAGIVEASRSTTTDGQPTTNGDLVARGDRVYVHTSNYPTTPRQAYIAAYNASTLAFLDERPLGNHDGSGGGVTAWNDSLWAPVNRDLQGSLAIRQINPDTLDVVAEYELGDYGSIGPQGISILGGYAFIPHGTVDSLNALDGWLIFHWTGTTWTFHGTLAYPTWTGTDGLTQYASQGIDFDVSPDCTVTAWTVSRYYDGHGHDAGTVARHPVTLASLDPCIPSQDPPPGNEDPPPGNEDPPPGGGGVQESPSPWPLLSLGIAALAMLGFAAWRVHAKPPALDAPSDRTLLVGAFVVLVIVAVVLTTWPYLPFPNPWT